MIRVKQATKQGWIECCDGGVADFSYPKSKYRRGRVQGGGTICPTITAIGGLYKIDKNTERSSMEGRYRIRKLTPGECARLMGLQKSDDEKMANIGISQSARYRCYGNGIITNCIELLFEHLYKAQYDPEFECFDENFTVAAMMK